jgi:alanyl-tRNA synthetase
LIWANDVGVPRDRIFRLDEKDNFWSMGDTGPCGYNSEIHYDIGPVASDVGHKDCQFPCDCGRYVELWNLVFMQFNRVCDACEPGTQKCIKTHDEPLPKPSVDTGAGLERLAAVLQGKLSNFETDLFRPLIEEAAELAKVEYGANHETDVSLRIIADHARAATFLISDGVIPSNEGRGYVLRLIIRRSLYHGQTLGLNEPFLFKMSGRVAEMMKGAFPELTETAHHVAKAIRVEEERYGHTTAIALQRLDEKDKKVHFVLGGVVYNMPLSQWRGLASSARRYSVDEVKMLSHLSHQPPLQGAPLAWISGEDVFDLHDTFGLRPDFLADIVRGYTLGAGELERRGEKSRFAGLPLACQSTENRI